MMFALALLLILLLAYTYLGYPILIGLLAQSRAPMGGEAGRVEPEPGSARGGALPFVTVCLPVYNGAD